jgi:ATP-dependent Clp protease ATP-binding subunit ClpA
MVLTGFKFSWTLSVMFERFTNKARHVIVLAQEEARRLNHNYIGTEHILLGLVAESDGLAFRALSGFGLTLDGTRDEVQAIVKRGVKEPTGHIPFTPRAKKTLELSLREALQLQHNYIGTEHILLGVIREGDGVGAQILRQHGDLLAIRTAMLDLLSAASVQYSTGRRWLRRRAAEHGDEGQQAEQSTLSATPAADTTLSEAARLAGLQPVGSHHLILAALADPDTAAARALVALGIDLDQARNALRTVDVTGTTDEPPEEAGRRQMVIHVTGDRLTVEATDPAIVKAGQAALAALGDQASPPGTIPGGLEVSASLTRVWQALHDSLVTIARQAAPTERVARASRPPEPAEPAESAEPAEPAEPAESDKTGTEDSTP